MTIGCRDTVYRGIGSLPQKFSVNGIHDRIILDSIQDCQTCLFHSPLLIYLYSLKERSGGDAIPLVLKTCAEFLEQEGI